MTGFNFWARAEFRFWAFLCDRILCLLKNDLYQSYPAISFSLLNLWGISLSMQYLKTILLKDYGIKGTPISANLKILVMNSCSCSCDRILFLPTVLLALSAFKWLRCVVLGIPHFYSTYLWDIPFFNNIRASLIISSVQFARIPLFFFPMI